ncbi:MAG TPA: hypothetical protein VGI71_16170 [Scandinavium sp.]|jgi:hypothetical protein
MNDQANKILVELLKKATDGIDAAVSFSKAQIPDVVHQLLVWNAVSSLLIQVMLLAGITACVFSMVYAWKHANDVDFCMAITLILGFVTAVQILILFQYFDWLKIWLAPKLYLLEYAASLVK